MYIFDYIVVCVRYITNLHAFNLTARIWSLLVCENGVVEDGYSILALCWGIDFKSKMLGTLGFQFITEFQNQIQGFPDVSWRFLETYENMTWPGLARWSDAAELPCHSPKHDLVESERKSKPCTQDVFHGHWIILKLFIGKLFSFWWLHLGQCYKSTKIMWFSSLWTLGTGGGNGICPTCNWGILVITYYIIFTINP